MSRLQIPSMDLFSYIFKDVESKWEKLAMVNIYLYINTIYFTKLPQRNKLSFYAFVLCIMSAPCNMCISADITTIKGCK